MWLKPFILKGFGVVRVFNRGVENFVENTLKNLLKHFLWGKMWLISTRRQPSFLPVKKFSATIVTFLQK